MPLHVAEHGREDAPTIVLLHGGGGAGWMWRPQVEALSSEYRLIVPDLPEQGESTDAGPFSMKSAAAQVAALIRERVPAGLAHVVGLSEGAQVALQLLADAPEVVDHAVLSSALVRPLPGGGLNSEGVLRWSYRTSIAPFRSNAWWIRLNMRHAAGVPHAYYEDFARSFATLTEDGFVHLMAANQAFRLPEGLAAASAPTLVVAGQHEYRAMKASVADIVAALPNARAAEVRYSPKRPLAEEHNWNMVEPELFTSMVRAWIRDEPLPERVAVLQVP